MEYSMTRILTASVLALSLAAGVTGPASAQSYNAPAGIPTVTAPGGLNDAGAVQRSTVRDTRLGTLPADADLTTGSVRRPHHAR
jgi:hypothetical protein